MDLTDTKTPHQIPTRDFGSAIAALKSGYRLAREGWNGKRMFIYLNKGSFDFKTSQEQAGVGKLLSIWSVKPDLFEKGDVGTVTRMPSINMKDANGATVTGWLASQTDVLAEDWTVVE